MSSNWSRATMPLLDDQLLALILKLAFEFEQQTGRCMTVAELRVALNRSGA